MKNIIKKITILSTASLMMMSCSDFLDVDPLDSFSEKVVFGNLETINGYVMQRYTNMKDPLDRYALRFACDEAWNNFNWYGQNGIQWGYMSPDYEGGCGSWFDYYPAIQNCNLFLDQIPQMETLKTNDNSTKLIEQYIGEVTFLRAFYYADLISRYGGVPLSKTAFKLGMSDDEMYIARDSYDDCVTFVTDELSKAATALPVKYEDKYLGRATKGAALALKARVLLYAASELHNPGNANPSKWLAAKKAIEDVIFLNEDGTSDKNKGSKLYALDPDYAGLFKNPLSKEIIFEKVFSSEYGHFFDQYNSPNGFTGWSETCINQGLVDDYEIASTGEIPNKETLYGNSTYGKEYEIGETPWDGRDPRFYATIGCDGQQWKGREIEFYIYKNGGGGKDSSKGGVEEWNASKTGFYLRKFMTDNLKVSFNDKSTVPWIYFRLGEMYLNYAEALYHTGDETGAQEYLEKIRNRARGGNPNILPKITTTGEELMKAIQHERRIELAFEEHRFFDVRRWKIASVEETKGIWGVNVFKDKDSGKKSYKIQKLTDTYFNEANYYFAIPNSERQKNGKLDQNSGYAGAAN